MKKMALFLILISVITILLILPSAAAKLGAPQDMDGLQVANITYYLGDSFVFYEPTLTSDIIVRSTAYTQGLDIAKLIASIDTGSNTKIRLTFTWQASDEMIFNAICIKDLPSDFSFTVSANGISSITGTSYSQAFNYIDQQDGWYKFDTFSFSATQTPVFSQIYSLNITIDGGSAHLTTLADNSIILSLSMLPYNLNAASDLQYNIGYQDAQKVYKDILNEEKQNAFESGKKSGYNEGIQHAENVLIPDAERNALEQGYSQGYINGKQEGLELANGPNLRDLIFSIPEAHLTALNGFTNWDLLGYNLYDLFGGLATLLIVAVIFKIGLHFLL